MRTGIKLELLKLPLGPIDFMRDRRSKGANGGLGETLAPFERGSEKHDLGNLVKKRLFGRLTPLVN